MPLKGWEFSALLLSSFAVNASETNTVPSDPTTWYGDFRSMIIPTDGCPGGTIEQLRKRMSVSEPYFAHAADAAQRFPIRTLSGIEDSDRVHEFYFSSELPGDGFWGFSGYLVARGSCVIHAKVTSIDN